MSSIADSDSDHDFDTQPNAPDWSDDVDVAVTLNVNHQDADDSDDEYDGVRRTHDDSMPNAHFDLDTVPSNLAADDGLDQTVINAALDNTADSDQTRRKFEDLPFHRITMKELKTIYEKHNFRKAFRLMGMRTEIAMDPDMMYDPNDPDLAWDIPSHYLDFLLVVADDIGFDTILPNVKHDPNFVFSLDLHQPARAFKGKHVNMGFALEQCMLYIGKSRGKDNIWIAMAPPDFFSEDVSFRHKHRTDAVSSLTGRHYWMLVMYFAHVISEALPARGIYCSTVYPDLSDSPRSNVEACTNLLENTAFELFHNDLRTLHREFARGWENWVDNAPASWKEDGFITSRRPITVLCRYGQNQPIADPTSIRTDNRYWHEERNYLKIRLVTVAIASHLSVKKVNDWHNIPVEDIIASNDIIYDSAYPLDREEVDLPNLDLLDEDGRELNIFDAAGYRIPRRIPLFSPQRLPCGILVRLDKAHEIFTPAGFDSEFEDDDYIAPRILMYPQAFTRTLGHIQVDAVPAAFKSRVAKINDAVAAVKVTDPLSDDDDDDDFIPDNEAAVFSTDLLAYNSIMHNARPRASQHDAQLGHITNSGAGSHALHPAQKRIATKLRTLCDKSLPHEHFNQRTEHEKVPTDLRLEVISTVDFKKLKVGERNGSRFYRNVIVELAKTWNRPDVHNPMKVCLAPLKPWAFPGVYSWATYGLTTLLKKLWTNMSPMLHAGKQIPATTIEITSVLERTLNFAHTGNAAVIATNLMNPLFVGLSLIKYGMPTFSDIFKMGDTLTDLPYVPDNLWPRDSITKQPRLASKRAQILTYGVEHWETYRALFSMKFATITLPRDVFPKHSPLNRYCLVIADTAVKRFISDTKVLVRDGIYKETKEAIDSDDPALREGAKRRRDAVEMWFESEYPLGYGDDAYLMLMRCLQKPGAAFALPLGDENSMSTLELAALLYNMAKPSNPKQCQAPLTKKGTCLAIIKVAISLIIDRVSHVQHTHGTPEQYATKILAVILDNHKIQHVPWYAPAQPRGIGRPSKQAVYNHWRSTAKTLESGQTAAMQVIDLEEQQDIEARTIIRQAEMTSATTEWNAIGLKISDLPKYFHKQNLPADCDLDCASLPTRQDYVSRTYSWVMNHYNPKKPIHHLALIIACMFTKVIPDISHGPAPSRIADVGRNTDVITAAVRAQPWTGDDSTRKGSSNPHPFLIMVFVYIVAMMEPESPLRRAVDADPKIGLGQAWTKKHGPKFINPFNMVRMGLAEAHNLAIYKSPKYGSRQTWNMKSVAELTSLYNRLIATFKERPYGPYKATSMIFGPTVAQRMADPIVHGLVEFPAPPMTKSVSSAASSSSKRTLDALDAEDEHLYPASKPPSKRRRVIASP